MSDGRPLCGTCPHFLRADAKGDGQCRGGLPTPFLIARTDALGRPQTLSAWPPVNKDLWCGQHPDFVRWYSQNRAALIEDASLANADAAGEG